MRLCELCAFVLCDLCVEIPFYATAAYSFIAQSPLLTSRNQFKIRLLQFFQERPAMRRIISVTTLILSTCVSSLAQSKPPAPPSDYRQWESLATFREYGGLSPD